MDRSWTTEQPAVFAASERKTARGEPDRTQEDRRENSCDVPRDGQKKAILFPAAPEAVPPAARGQERKRSACAGRMTTVLAVLFLAGVAYGAALSGMLDRETAAALEQMTRGFLAGRAESGFWDVFLRAIGSSLLLGCAVFLSGFSAVGQPFAVFFLLFRAAGLGMSMGYFYAVLNGTGILLALFLLLPAGALSGYALLLACREALRMSGRFFAAMTREAAISPRAFRMYGVKFLIIGLMLVLAALLDAGCTRLFLTFWAK